MKTDLLIDTLAAQLAPVQPLGRPGRRAFVWLSATAAYLGLLAASMTSGTDLSANGLRPGFIAPQIAALAAGVLAAVAAFSSVVPGYSRRIFVWAAVAAAAWVATLTVGSLQQWSRPADLFAADREWVCVATIVLGGAPLSAMLWRMLRLGAPLNPAATGAFGALSVAVLANVGACVSHPHADNAVTLAWHGATILALVAAAAAATPFVMTWRATRARHARGPRLA
jgi:hypothetical protein